MENTKMLKTYYDEDTYVLIDREKCERLEKEIENLIIENKLSLLKSRALLYKVYSNLMKRPLKSDKTPLPRPDLIGRSVDKYLKPKWYYKINLPFIGGSIGLILGFLFGKTILTTLLQI